MRGVISGGNRETAQAGAEILAAGGNAADAAVAATFVSFVAEIGFVHLGGSGMAQIRHPVKGVQVYDFFSNYPGLGRRSELRNLDFQEVVVDYGAARQSFHLGRAAVAVPGNIFGLCLIAREMGTLPLSQLLQPAIDRAEKGVILDAFQADTCKLLAPLYTHTAPMRRIFAPGGKLVQAGDRVRIPGLARTLRGLARHGEAYLRKGRLGQTLIEDQRRRGGLLTPTDLRRYRVIKRSPIEIDYRGNRVLLPPLSSLGGVLTAFTVKLLAHFRVRRLEPGTVDHLQLITEVLASASQARRNWGGRPNDSAAAELLAPETVQLYAQQLRRRLRRQRPGAAPAEPKEHSSTSHLSVLDESGLAVSLTTTAGESAGYVVPGTGLIPNNMLGEEDLHPGGFHSGTPGQRLHTMITPSLVMQGDRVRYVLGTGGSTRIRSAILQILCHLLDFELPLARSVDAPRIHYENEVVQCEGGIRVSSMDALEARGYQVNRWKGRSIYFGGAHCAGLEDGVLVGAGDPRRGGAVSGNL